MTVMAPLPPSPPPGRRVGQGAFLSPRRPSKGRLGASPHQLTRAAATFASHRPRDVRPGTSITAASCKTRAGKDSRARSTPMPVSLTEMFAGLWPALVNRGGSTWT